MNDKPPGSHALPFLDAPNTGRIAFLAAEIAIVAPLKKTGAANDCCVPWAIVEEIRRELETAGWPWKRLAAQTRRIVNQRRRDAARRNKGA